MITKSHIIIKPVSIEQKDWILRVLRENWGSESVVSRGKLYDASNLPGFIAECDNQLSGLLTYHVENRSCEIVTLDSIQENRGVGSVLIQTMITKAKSIKCKRLWLITTNDNLHALKFYQKRGFDISAIYPNAITESRKIKPEIPLVGQDDIPIRDEIELEIKFY